MGIETNVKDELWAISQLFLFSSNKGFSIDKCTKWT